MSQQRLIWDLPTRIFHWSLVISLVAAWVTAEWGFEEIHRQVGYFILGLVMFRLLWGIFGTKHARFSSFIPGPRAVWHSALALLGRAPEPYHAGHNPLGSLMVVLLLILLAIQAVTGLFTGGEIWSGPYYHVVEKSTAKSLESLHHLNFNFILAAVAFHISAVFLYLFAKKRNLIRPMLTGKKSAQEVNVEDAIPGSRLGLALALALVVIVFVYWLVVVAPPPVDYDYYY